MHLAPVCSAVYVQYTHRIIYRSSPALRSVCLSMGVWHGMAC
jgi:hypothetical protein